MNGKELHEWTSKSFLDATLAFPPRLAQRLRTLVLAEPRRHGVCIRYRDRARPRQGRFVMHWLRRTPRHPFRRDGLPVCLSGSCKLPPRPLTWGGTRLALGNRPERDGNADNAQGCPGRDGLAPSPGSAAGGRGRLPGLRAGTPRSSRAPRAHQPGRGAVAMATAPTRPHPARRPRRSPAAPGPAAAGRTHGEPARGRGPPGRGMQRSQEPGGRPRPAPRLAPGPHPSLCRRCPRPACHPGCSGRSSPSRRVSASRLSPSSSRN